MGMKKFIEEFASKNPGTTVDIMIKRFSILKKEIRRYYETNEISSNKEKDELLQILYQVEDEIFKLLKNTKSDLIEWVKIQKHFSLKKLRSLIIENTNKKFGLFATNKWMRGSK